MVYKPKQAGLSSLPRTGRITNIAKRMEGSRGERHGEINGYQAFDGTSRGKDRVENEERTLQHKSGKQASSYVSIEKYPR